MLSIGIVGLPNVGKSTLFNALTKSKLADAQNYPFCTIEPNVGIVEVPDTRLSALSDISQSQKIVPTSIKFVDIAGLVKGAHEGEGLGNKFLQHIREVDAIAHVVRDFADKDITHVHAEHDPRKDADVINEELVLADWAVAQKLLEAAQKKHKGAIPKDVQKEIDVLAKVVETLACGKPVRSLESFDEDYDIIKKLQLITAKPMMYVVNTDEQHVSDTALLPLGDEPQVRVCARTEAELADLTDDEARAYLQDLGLMTSGLDRIIVAGYALLGLVTFFTSGVQETRAWTVKRETPAALAAGVIHTDFIAGFIKADVASVEDFVAAGGWSKIKETGKLRLEGKDYHVQDGDVMYFHVKT